MSPALVSIAGFLLRLAKIAFEVFVLDFIASFFDGYRNTRWRYQERFDRREWAR